MIRGVTKNILLLPVANKNIDEAENFVPSQIDIRNGHITDSANWERRPGYAERWDLGVDEAVTLLIPDSNGYAVTGDGKIWDLMDQGQVGTTTLDGSNRPQYVVFQPTSSATKQVIIVDGGTVTKIESGTTGALGGSPPSFKFIGTLDGYVIGCGHNDIDFRWSALEDAETWAAANTNSVLGDGEKIRYFLVHRRNLMFFKDRSIEQWSNVGGDRVWARTFYIERGCGADYSVVKGGSGASETLYWFASDGDFYRLNGVTPDVISGSYRKVLDTLTTKSEIYGFDFRKESRIRWFAPTDKKCFVYDYRQNVFSEDNQWEDGDWSNLPIESYMELSGDALIGDSGVTGKIYSWSQDFSKDGSLPIRLYRKFAVTMAPDGFNARANRLRLRVKRGAVSATNPVATIRWRIDRGDWELPETLDLGNVGDREPYIDIYGLGIGREIEFEMVETDTPKFLVTHAHLTAEPLLR